VQLPGARLPVQVRPEKYGIPGLLVRSSRSSDLSGGRPHIVERAKTSPRDTPVVSSVFVGQNRPSRLTWARCRERISRVTTVTMTAVDHPPAIAIGPWS
jgi:hypothetical protein